MEQFYQIEITCKVGQAYYYFDAKSAQDALKMACYDFVYFCNENLANVEKIVVSGDVDRSEYYGLFARRTKRFLRFVEVK